MTYGAQVDSGNDRFSVVVVHPPGQAIVDQRELTQRTIDDAFAQYARPSRGQGSPTLAPVKLQLVKVAFVPKLSEQPPGHAYGTQTCEGWSGEVFGDASNVHCKSTFGDSQRHASSASFAQPPPAAGPQPNNDMTSSTITTTRERIGRSSHGHH